MEYLLLVLVLIIGAIVIFSLTKSKTEIRPSYEKKSELIKSYEDDLQEIIEKYQDDKELLNRKKIEFLKSSSKELHNNIFFDEDEVKQIIKKLASM